METIEADGEWWLPEEPDKRVPGRLTFDPDDGGRLRLIGSFLDEIRSRSYPRIHGHAGQEITLERCFTTGLTRNALSGSSIEEIHADVIFRGAWYDPDEEPGGDAIAVKLGHLVYWIRPKSMSDGFGPSEDAQGPILASVSARPFESIKVDSPDGTLQLHQTFRQRGDGIAEQSISLDMVAHLEVPDVRPWRELITSIGMFQDVVSLGMDKVAFIEEVRLFHPDVAPEGPRDRYRHPIDVFARWSDRDARANPKDRHTTEVLFHYDAVGADGLVRLLEVAKKYQPALRRVMATRAARMYSSDRLINRCAALESFDRQRFGRDRGNFKTKLTACMDLAGDPFSQMVGDTSAWLGVLKRRRNHVAHHLEVVDDNDGLVDHVMAETTYFLFALCTMREAALHSEVFDRFAHNQRVRSLGAQVPQVVNLDC